MASEPRLLVDTSAWIEYFRPKGDPVIVRRVREAVENDRVVLTDLVWIELLRGNPRQRRRADQLAELFPVLETNSEVWAHARSVAKRLAEAGTPVPNTDLLISSVAAVHRVGMIHRDAHFEVISRLP